MVADEEPLEILPHQPLLSEDEVREHINDDTEYYVNLRNKLIQAERLLSISTIVLALVNAIMLGVKQPVPFYTHGGVFGYLLWSVAIVLSMVALGYTALDWWKTRSVEPTF